MRMATRRPTKRLQRTSCRHLLLLLPLSARGTKPLNRGTVGRRDMRQRLLTTHAWVLLIAGFVPLMGYAYLFANHPRTAEEIPFLIKAFIPASFLFNTLPFWATLCVNVLIWSGMSALGVLAYRRVAAAPN
jgi:hypothetical protein